MNTISTIFSIVLIVVVGLLTWWRQRTKGEDAEPDWLAVVKNMFITMVGAIIVWQIVTTISRIAVTYWWYQDVGYPAVYTTQLTYHWGLWMIGFLAAWGMFSVTQWVAEMLVPRLPARPENRRRNSGYANEAYDDPYDTWPVVHKYYVWVSRFIKLLASLWFAFTATWQLSEFMKSSNLVSWGKADPIFGFDYSFYDVTLPWLHGVVGWLSWVLLVSFGVAVATHVYLLWRENEFAAYVEDSTRRETQIAFSWVRHITMYAMAFFAIFAINSVLRPYDLLVDGNSSIISGAGYIDVVTRIPSLRFMAWVWFLMIIISAIYLFIPRKWGVPAIAGGVVVLSLFVSLVILPWMTGLQYNTNPSKYEQQYIVNQIASTRYAFDLDKIQEKGQLSYVTQATGDQMKANAATLEQTRIADWQPLLVANKTVNKFLPYYDFNDMDVDRYVGQEVMLSVRELNTGNLPQTGGTQWVNEHFRYTHGYGYTVASVSAIDAQGESKWLVHNIPPDGAAQFGVARPEIYFGESTNTFVFVGGQMKEFGKPEGTTVQEVVYDGPSGVSVGSFGRQLVLAIDMNDYRVLFTNLIDADTKALYDRSLDARASRLASFLWCDQDPYPVLGGEEVVWLRDCYTSSNNLPYSAHVNGVNYMRGSVKMTVGAYTGKTDLYAVDDQDPILRTWMQVYPGVVQPLSSMPAYLQEHLRYPDDLLVNQADAYALYHIQDAMAFYNHQIMWSRAQETQTVGGEPAPSDPRFVMMRVPGEVNQEFVSNVFYTPAGTGQQTLIAGITARSDKGHYGEIVQYDFPTDQSVVGPQMVEARINQDGYISGQLSLWDQKGSQVLWGQMIGLPVTLDENQVSMVYIRSLYLQGEGAKIPSIKLVIVSQGDRLIYAKTLEEALAQLYSGTVNEAPAQSEAAPIEVTGDQAQLIAQAKQHFDAAQACAGSGDWVCYGNEMAALKAVLDALSTSQ